MSRPAPEDVGGDVATDGARPAAVRSRHRGAHRAPRPAIQRVVLGVVAVFVVSLAVLVLVRPWAGDGPAATAPDPAIDVAAWVLAEVPGDTPVTAPDEVRVAAGASANRFVEGSPDGALQVVEGEPPAGALVLARFEGSGGTTLSVVDPAPGRPTEEELASRRRLAAAVLDNPVAGATGRAADVLRAGDIDARLLGLLAGLVSRMDVHVADLPPAPDEPEDPRPPARRLLVDEAAGNPLTPGAASTDELVEYLEAQRAPYAPDSVETTEDGVLVAFDYLSAPDAAVTAASP